MAFEIIPWRKLPDFTQEVRLSGEIFKMRFIWNTSRKYWTLTISDANGDVLIAGQKLVMNHILFDRYADTRLPQGDIFLIQANNLEARTGPIGRNDIGVNVFLVYGDF